MALPKKISKTVGACLALVALASTVTFGTLAQADTTVGDGDGDTPVSTSPLNKPLEFGTVCVGQTYNATILVAIQRTDAADDTQRTFGNGETVTVSLKSPSDDSADLTESMNDSTIVLPSDWLSQSVGTMSDSIQGEPLGTAEIAVSFTPSVAGAGTANVFYKANGDNYLGNPTLDRQATTKVNWTAEDCFTYDFTGFFSPVDNMPTLNKVKAGQAIPVKFSLDGDQGLEIFADGYPKSFIINCDTQADMDSIESTMTAGGSSLSYDPIADQYVYVWKTQKSWAGSCRQLDVMLDDGTTHSAWFNFTR